MSPSRPTRRPRRSRWVLLLVVFVGGFATLELGLRVQDMVTGQGFLSGHRNPLRVHRKPVRPFRQFGAELYGVLEGRRAISSTHAELYPLQKPPGTFRIVAFGGSTTHNVEAWEAEGIHYPLVLQQLLRERTGRDDIEVINVGFSAYSTAHSLTVMALDVLSWDPDLIIVSHNANDRSVAYFPDFVPDYANKYSHRAYMGPDYRTLYTTPNVLMQWSQAYWFLTQTWEHLLHGDPADGIHHGAYGDKPPPFALGVFRRNLRSFAALARALGADVVFGAQALHTDPWRFEHHMGYKPYNDIVVYPEHPVLVLHHRAYNDAMRHLAGEVDAGFVDNAALMDDHDAWFTDHVHYTPEGIRVLAENYADYLQDRFEVLR